MLAQSGSNGSAYPRADSYSIPINVDSSHLSMTSNSGVTHSIVDTTYTTAEAIGIDVGGETNLTTPLPGSIQASVVVSTFQYLAS